MSHHIPTPSKSLSVTHTDGRPRPGAEISATSFEVRLECQSINDSINLDALSKDIMQWSVEANPTEDEYLDLDDDEEEEGDEEELEYEDNLRLALKLRTSTFSLLHEIQNLREPITVYITYFSIDRHEIFYHVYECADLAFLPPVGGDKRTRANPNGAGPHGLEVELILNIKSAQQFIPVETPVIDA